jgi:hypothetical protein
VGEEKTQSRAEMKKRGELFEEHYLRCKFRDKRRHICEIKRVF